MNAVADLHNHSCLSPCGSLEMSPRAMAARAREIGTEILALTDHNSALNCPAMEAACAREGIVFFPGMEAQPREEVHVLCLFPDLASALSFNGRMEPLLGPFPNDPERFGDQVYVDDEENIAGEVERYLGQSLDLSLEELSNEVLNDGGILVPAHIDRDFASMKISLGFLPDGPWTAVETTHVPPEGISPRDWPMIVSSDAHYLGDMGKRRTSLELPEGFRTMDAAGRFSALRQALSSAPREFLFRPRRAP